jgi:hypothetical protein
MREDLQALLSAHADDKGYVSWARLREAYPGDPGPEIRAELERMEREGLVESTPSFGDWGSGLWRLAIQ